MIPAPSLLQGDKTMRLKSQRIAPYLYIAPAFLVMAGVIVYPIISMLAGSFFTTKNGVKVFAGLRNYRLVFADDLFWNALKNNVLLFLCVPILTLFSLLIAVILFNKIKGWRFYRSIIFVPYILSISVVGIIFSYLLQYNGVINTVLRNIGLENFALDWLGDPNLALPTVATVIMWKQLGFGVVLFLARLMSIDVFLYEAADIDGASWLKKFIFITIPQTKAIIEFYVIISLIDMLSWVFNFIFVMTAGGPGNKTMVLEYLIYKKSFGGGDFNIAMAISALLLVIASILIILHQLILRKED